MSAVRVEHVYKEYKLGTQTVHALQDISMVVAPGRFLAIAGPSGSGKTTLLNMIGCIDTPSKGDIFIGEEMVSRKTPDELAALRARTLGFVFQTFNLLPVLDAWENVEYPMLQRPDLSKKERHERVRHYLETVGLANRMRQRPNELSGGQRQRVAIARALATEPKVLLCDEATSALDPHTALSILRLLRDLNRRQGMTIVVVTHDIKVASYLCHRSVVLEKGSVVDRIDMARPEPRSRLGRFFFETAKGWTDQTELPQEDA